jgi:5'(3')-deoxyribonucleotidase
MDIVNKENIIALDFDGVIADSDAAKVRYAREVLGLDVRQRDLKRRHFRRIFGEAQGDRLYTQIIQDVYTTERMLTDLQLMPHAREGMAQLRAMGLRYVIVTSRLGSIEEAESMAEWAWRFLVDRGLAVAREDFINTNHRSKLEACLAAGAFGLVDDDYAKLEPVIRVGLQGYLFTTKTNTQAERVHDPFEAVRVEDWLHLVAVLSASGRGDAG